jgi:hypothetical protein
LLRLRMSRPHSAEGASQAPWRPDTLT